MLGTCNPVKDTTTIKLHSSHNIFVYSSYFEPVDYVWPGAVYNIHVLMVDIACLLLNNRLELKHDDGHRLMFHVFVLVD